MRAGTVVLTHGPLDPPNWWTDVASVLTRAGHHVVTPQVEATPPPYAVGWVAGTARPLHATEIPLPLVLVAHGTAGPLLPALGRTQRVVRRRVGGYVFVDATLPRQGSQTHLDLLRAADPDSADRLHGDLHQAGQQAADHPLVTAHDFWTEPLPPAIDWPDAPCAYIRTGASDSAVGPTEWWARSAAHRGWDVDDSGRPLSDTLVNVIARLPG